MAVIPIGPAVESIARISAPVAVRVSLVLIEDGWTVVADITNPIPIRIGPFSAISRKRILVVRYAITIAVRLARVTDAVIVRIILVRIVITGAVVGVVPDAVLVQVSPFIAIIGELILIVRNAVPVAVLLARIADAIAVLIPLIGVGDLRTVVRVVPDPVTIRVHLFARIGWKCVVLIIEPVVVIIGVVAIQQAIAVGIDVLVTTIISTDGLAVAFGVALRYSTWLHAPGKREKQQEK